MSRNHSKPVLAAALLAMAGVSLPVAAGQYHGQGHPVLQAGQDQYRQHVSPGQGAQQPLKLGVRVAEIPQAELARLGLEYGVRILGVQAGSVAAASGLQTGDVITSVGERPAYSIPRLLYLLNDSQGAADIGLTRNGEAMQVKADFAKPQPQARKAMLGVRLQRMTADLKQAFGSDGKSGVLISQVIEGTAASKAGLQAGDVIVALGDKPVGKVKDVYRLVRSHAPGELLDVTLLRDRKEQVLPVELGSAPARAQAGKGQWHPGHPHHRWHHGGGSGKHCPPMKRWHRS